MLAESGDQYGKDTVSLTRWTPAGAQAWPAVPVAHGPYGVGMVAGLAIQGGDAIVAWADTETPTATGGLRLSLARIRITP